jgi:bifunctional DNase/RNase
MSHLRTTGQWCLPLLGLAVSCAAASSRQADRSDDFVTVELAQVGMDLTRGSPVVLLRDPVSGQVLPILVGLPEAHAIARALHGIAVPRPMTHDLLAGLVRELGAEVIEVQVHDVRDGTYHGRIRLRSNGDTALREVDSRPSDALALALRLHTPIRVRRTLLRDAPDVEVGPPDGDQPVVQTIGLNLVPPRVTPGFRAGARPAFPLSRRERGQGVRTSRDEVKPTA